MKATLRYIAMPLLVLSVAACENEFERILPEDAQVNFFAYSPVQGTFGQTFATRYDLPILIDTDQKVNGTISSTITTYPYFRFYQGSPVWDTPTPNAPAAMDETAVYYYRMPAGRHKLTFFCDTIPVNTKVVEKDFAGKSYELFYFTDSLRDDKIADFKLFTVPDARRPVHTDRYNYRLVNLSPDAGSLSIRFQRREGGYTDPAAVAAYAGYSEYQGLDTTGLIIRNELSMQVLNETGDVLFTQRLNPSLNCGYHFVVGGFAQAQQGIQYPYALDDAGQPLYRTATVPAGLALTVRRIY